LTRVFAESVGRGIARSEARVLCESSDEAQVIARSEARELWVSSDEAQVIARSEARELWVSSDEAIFLVLGSGFFRVQFASAIGVAEHNEAFIHCLAKTNRLF
jgi:hypothetical protein